MGRSLGTVKGALLTAVGLFLLRPPAPGRLRDAPAGASSPEHLEAVRRFGTLGLFAYCLLTLLLSSGERAIYFSPAEVNFLFPGPFRRRQVLAYKLAGQLMGVAIMAVFMTAWPAPRTRPGSGPGSWGCSWRWCSSSSSRWRWPWWPARWAPWPTAAAAGWRSPPWRPWPWRAGSRPAARPSVLEPWDVLARVERSGVVQAVLSPLRWFVEAFAAERLWPDLLQWAALGLAVDAALLAFVFALDAQYLETAAAASARIYARIERMRRGGVGPTLRGPGRKRVGLPMLPWWGGAGPIAWRQLTTAQRDFTRLLAVLLVLGSGRWSPPSSAPGTAPAPSWPSRGSSSG